jgi:hypothetical protein
MLARVVSLIPRMARINALAVDLFLDDRHELRFPG